MKIGRADIAGSPGFVVGVGADDPWTPLSAIGVEAATTADVIANASRIAERVTSRGGESDIASGVRLSCPVVQPSKILAIGLNYMEHIRETGATRPERPILFAKYPSSLTGPTDPVWLDQELTEQLDYEAELAVVIGRPSRRLTEGNALDHVFGYAVANDVSARDWQRKDPQFSRSKSYDTFCPIGPWLTTADEVPDPQVLGIRSFVNGESRQNSTTAHMIFTVVDLLVYLSASMTLYPGDVILTGTPPGVGLGRTPPQFLAVGDQVDCEIDHLGRIENRVIADPQVRL